MQNSCINITMTRFFEFMIDCERYLLWTGKYYPNKMYGFYDTKSIQKILKVDLFESCLLDYVFIKVYGLYFMNMI